MGNSLMMKLTLVSRSPNLIQISCAGHVTQVNLQAGSDPLSSILSPEDYTHSILIDLNQAQFIDSSGVGWMLKCHKHCKQAGGRIVFHSAPPLVRQTLELLQMGKVLCLAKDAKSARALVDHDLQLQLISSANGLLRLRAAGGLTDAQLNKAASDPLEQVIGPEGYAQRLLLDLSKLQELNPAGVNWLIKVGERCQAAGGEIVCYALPAALRSALEQVAAASALNIADNEAAAALLLKPRS
jgi:anti-anti-sigma factor